ncbi:helix-turn-helix domain-containing protein, partial [Pseudoduganella ginsengisoli]
AEGLATAPARAARARLSAISGDDVLAAMDRHGWQILRAAQALGISRPSLYKLLAAHPQVRRASAIPEEEIRHALARHGPDVERCASALRTPADALRRRLLALNVALGDGAD